MISKDAEYLREKAVQFRRLAHSYRSDITDKLLELAAEFDAKAGEIERRSTPGTGPR